MRALRIFLLILFFLKEVLVANLQIALLLLKDPLLVRPALIRIPLDIKSDRGLFILSSMVTLTPGTLSLNISSDRKFLYVHVTHTEAPDEVVRSIKQNFERKLMEVGC